MPNTMPIIRTREFTVRDNRNRAIPSREGEIWIDAARRRWRVLAILGDYLTVTHRGDIVTEMRFVGEAL